MKREGDQLSNARRLNGLISVEKYAVAQMAEHFRRGRGRWFDSIQCSDEGYVASTYSEWRKELDRCGPVF